jgi:hypothetical protein
MITNKEIIEWLMKDGYSEEDAIESLKDAKIETREVTIITYDNGIIDIIYKDEVGTIIHLNPFV